MPCFCCSLLSVVVCWGRVRGGPGLRGDKVQANGRKSLKFAAAAFHRSTEGAPVASDPCFDPPSCLPRPLSSVVSLQLRAGLLKKHLLLTFQKEICPDKHMQMLHNGVLTHCLVFNNNPFYLVLYLIQIFPFSDFIKPIIYLVNFAQTRVSTSVYIWMSVNIFCQ